MAKYITEDKLAKELVSYTKKLKAQEAKRSAAEKKAWKKDFNKKWAKLRREENKKRKKR